MIYVVANKLAQHGDVYVHSSEGIQILLKDYGFEITALYGNYDLKPFTNSSNMVVIVSSMT